MTSRDERAFSIDPSTGAPLATATEQATALDAMQKLDAGHIDEAEYNAAVAPADPDEEPVQPTEAPSEEPADPPSSEQPNAEPG